MYYIEDAAFKLEDTHEASWYSTPVIFKQFLKNVLKTHFYT